MTNLEKLASALAVLALLPTTSFADSDVISLPPAATNEGVTKTCAEAQRDAWFVREMQRTDGETNPEPSAVPECAIDEKQA